MVQTTITDPAAIASYNRGPLTAIYQPPSSCLSTLTYNNVRSGMYFGHAGTNYYDSSCYPSSYSSTYTLIADSGNWNQYYYSPAQCPEAWAHATTFTSYFTNNGDTSGQILLALGSDTTAVLCCPSGYTSYGTAGHQCGTSASSGAEITFVTTTLSNNQLVVAKPATTTITSDGYLVWGDGIPIWWQSTDLAAFAAATKTTTSSPKSTNTRSTASSPTKSPTASSAAAKSGSSGLSTGAKIAIGVTIPVVFLAVLLGTFFYFRRRGTRQASELEVGRDQGKTQNELSTGGALLELDEQPQEQKRQQRYELLAS